MNQGHGSAEAVIAISRKKSRYTMQDQLLSGFTIMPRSTAKEVAVEVLDWRYEKYCSSQKRAADLASKKLSYLEIIGNRVCRQSGADAHVYQITDRGRAHLHKRNIIADSVAVAVDKPDTPGDNLDTGEQCKSLMQKLRS